MYNTCMCYSFDTRQVCIKVLIIVLYGFNKIQHMYNKITHLYTP